MKEKEEILALDKKEKIAQKVFDKIIYIIEFILSAIFMIFFYKKVLIISQVQESFLAYFLHNHDLWKNTEDT